MLYEVELGRSCDSLRNELEIGLYMANRVLEKEDSLLNVMSKQIKLRDESIAYHNKLYSTQSEHVKALQKEVKKQKVITGIVSGVAVLLLILAL